MPIEHSDLVQRLGFPARIAARIHARRANRAVKHHKAPTIIPYIGYGGDGWVRVLGRVLYLKTQTREHRRYQTEFAAVSRVRGWRTFTSVVAPEVRVRVSIDGTPIGEVEADRGGVIDATITASLAPGWHTAMLEVIDDGNAETDGRDAGPADVVEAPINVVDPAAEVGVISDIDDTILVTALPRPLLAAWNTFVLDEHARDATPGMPVLLDHIAAHNPSLPTFYLSTGPWNSAPALSRFLERNLYPMGTLLLTDWGPTVDRWFRSGREHKRQELRRLAGSFPGIRWILIGDDGQHDETIYHEFATEFPDRVAAVAIRQLSVSEAVLAGGRSKARLNRTASGVPWVYGPDGATLKEELHRIGLV